MGKSKAHIRYKLHDGTIVPGATTPLGLLAKPALIPWANKLGLQGIEVSKFVDDKASIGSLAHDMILCHFKKETADTSDYTANQISAAENSFLSFLEWEKKYIIEPILTEAPLVSEKWKFGGTIDLYAKLDGVPILVDFKTGSGIYDEHFYQCAAYRQLLMDNGYECASVKILNIPRTEDEQFNEATRAGLVYEWEIFRACLEIYNFKKALKKEEA
jgi:hypothetical protein